MYLYIIEYKHLYTDFHRKEKEKMKKGKEKGTKRKKGRKKEKFQLLRVSGVFWWCNCKSDELRNRSKRLRTPVALLLSLLENTPGKGMDPLVFPLMG